VKKIVNSSQYPVVGSQSGGNESEVRRSIYHLPFTIFTLYSLLYNLNSNQYSVVGSQSGGNKSEVRRSIYHLPSLLYTLYSIISTVASIR
jgi:hypothetical protein